MIKPTLVVSDTVVATLWILASEPPAAADVTAALDCVVAEAATAPAELAAEVINVLSDVSVLLLSAKFSADFTVAVKTVFITAETVAASADFKLVSWVAVKLLIDLKASIEILAAELVEPKPCDRLVATFTNIITFWPSAWRLIAAAAAAGVVAFVKAATGSVANSVVVKPSLVNKLSAAVLAWSAVTPEDKAAETATA